MLIKPHDLPVSEAETRAFLQEHDFGQLIAPGVGREFPIVVPTHYAFEGEHKFLMHFSRQNPVWAALRERPRAMFTVVGDYVYIPTSWNAGEEAPPEWGVPTSYYGAVQCEANARIIEDDEGMARILRVLLARMQPEGGHAPVTPGDNPYAKQFAAIAGVELTITSLRAKFKFGGNRPAAHREHVANKLAQRDGAMDAEARAHVMQRG